MQKEFDSVQDDLDTARSNIASLQGQLDNEQTAARQLEARIAELVEEKQGVVLSNGQLQNSIKVC